MQSGFLSKMVRAGSAGVLVALAGQAVAGPFTPGNIVVVRLGDGGAALTSAAAATFLDEYTPGGGFVQTVALPTAVSGSNRRATNSGSATSAPFLGLSTNGKYLLTVGYDADVATASVATTTSAVANRVVVRVGLDGTVDTTTALSDSSFSGSNIRAVASDDGSNLWLGGTATTAANGGVRFTTLGAGTSIQLSSTVTNIRVVNIFAGQVYCSSASGAFQGVSTVGLGQPTTAGQTISILPGFPTAAGPSSYDFFLADANTLYVADDRASTSGGGIQRWSLNSGTWTLDYTLVTAAGQGARGVTGYTNTGGSNVLFATTTSTTTPPLIVTIEDTGASSVSSKIVDAGANTSLRGIRILPGGPPPPPPPPPPPACAANCSGDTDPVTGKAILDVQDFTCFQNAFALGDLAKADVGGVVSCTPDGALSISDFTCFQNLFALGCP